MKVLRMIGRYQMVLIGISAVVGSPVASGASMPLHPLPGRDYVETAGFNSGHLQGIASNGSDAIYWSFTNKLVKTDTAGNTLNVVDVIDHHGDTTFVGTAGNGGRLYVAVNDRESSPPGQFNVANPNNPIRQWIYEYDANLNYINRHSVPQVVYGAGGVGYHNGKFLVVGGLPTSENRNYVYEYDQSFSYLATHALETGYTDRGIQTAEFAQGQWWFGTYQRQSGVRQLLTFNESLDQYDQFSFDASLGIAALPDGYFLIGSNRSDANGNVIGRVQLAVSDPVLGFKVVPIPVPEPNAVGMVTSGIVALVAFMSIRQRRMLSVATVVGKNSQLARSRAHAFSRTLHRHSQGTTTYR